MKKSNIIKWFSQPEPHNYPAAMSYLCLIFDEDHAGAMVGKLKKAKITEFKAKDIFRASGLSLLGISNLHVKKNLKKIKNGQKMSPILLVRNPGMGKVIVADGYHRMCAVYEFDEDAILKCKIVIV
jgi:hypothetical protein